METLPSLHTWNHQLERLAQLMNVLRICILTIVLLFVSVSQHLPPNTNTTTGVLLYIIKNQTYIYIWCAVYGLLTMFTFANPNWQRQEHSSLPNAAAVADIAMIAVLTYLMGGSTSGFAILILPFLATSCLFSYGRYPLLYAGFASSLVLLEVFVRYALDKQSFNSQETPLLVNQVALIGTFYLVPSATSFSVNYLMRSDSSLRAHRIAYDRISNLTQIVMNRMQEAAVVVDNTHRIWLFNRKARHYFPRLKVGQNAAFLHEITTRWQHNPKQDFELTIPLNGKTMHVRAIPLLQEETQFLTLFIRAESERLNEAQTLKLTSLGQLTANLAHEIRNPLSAIRQANGLLLESEEDNPMAEKLCGMIEKNISRIDTMIEEVSTLNKRDRINIEYIDLKTFLNNFTHEFHLIHPQSEGCLKTHFPTGETPMVRFDAKHLQQIVWNLCNNAWRHSKKQRNSLIISLRSVNEEQYSLRFRDDGEGVAEEHQTQLFEPFFTTQSHAEGTGLGLYISRELAHANKGDLRYLAREKAFELILPKAEEHD